MTIVYIIATAIAFFFFGVLFGRKNKKISDEIAAKANAAKEKAESELSELKAKIKA